MTKEKASSKLFWNLFFIYTANIIGKTSFSAATAALVSEEILTKTEAGIIGGGFWLLYAIGQFLGAFLVNKMSPYTMIHICIAGATISNFLIPYMRGFWPILLLWCLNGLLQFGLWPSVLKLVSEEMVPKQRVGAMGRLAFCYCLGSMVSYVCTAVILKFTSWEYIFICCGVINGLSLIASLHGWRKCSPILKEEKTEKVTTYEKGKLSWKLIWCSGLIFFCLMVIIKSIADNGIKTWMPTIMVETYGATPSFTSMLSVGLLVVNLFGVIVTTFIYEKVKSDELKTLIILYCTILPMMLMLLNFKHMNIWVCTVLMSAVTLLFYGSGQVISMHYPGRFHRWNLVASVGAIINCFAAVGNMAATYLGGFIADHFGWGAMIGVWNALIVVFIGITILIYPLWRKFRRQ